MSKPNLNPNTVIIDNGTGYTKMGYAGNLYPTHVIPTTIAEFDPNMSKSKKKYGYDQVDYHIGYEAYNYRNSHDYTKQLTNAEITNFDYMEKFWNRCLFDVMRCEPSENVVVLTEPPMNSPENRETMAEIMFETFNVKGLHISVQATLALYSSWFSSAQGSQQKKIGLTGTVVDSGDGVTHIIPVANGMVIGSCIKHLPIAGSHVTKYIMNAIKDRKEDIKQEDLMSFARDAKDTYSYVSDDPVNEYEKFDERVRKYGVSRPDKCFKAIKTTNHIGHPLNVSLGYEIFMGPEIFFRPQLLDGKWSKGVHQHIDDCIQMCPIDTRRNLYQNIVLSGGTTQTENQNVRLENEMKQIVKIRKEENFALTQHKAIDVDVNVVKNVFQGNSVFHGGSMMSQSPEFKNAYKSRQDYLEYGPYCCRSNQVLQ